MKDGYLKVRTDRINLPLARNPPFVLPFIALDKSLKISHHLHPWAPTLLLFASLKSFIYVFQFTVRENAKIIDPNQNKLCLNASQNLSDLEQVVKTPGLSLLICKVGTLTVTPGAAGKMNYYQC